MVDPGLLDGRDETGIMRKYAERVGSNEQRLRIILYDRKPIDINRPACYKSRVGLTCVEWSPRLRIDLVMRVEVKERSMNCGTTAWREEHGPD